ncbi:DUF5819 family protein [Kitasatospora aureofaciens]|uniref:DUF5819 family protein n=1 Tax=Kitasatospora aureofaciens TaxID=1894 RepID=UPI0027E07FB4|nr:DUF5819 family protein [Kitasatospora aureofaciens]
MAAVAVGAFVHLGMVFLSLAPPNTFSAQNAAAINGYVSHEFEQSWRLFAPNLPLENTDVQARAAVLKPDGTTQITGWTDLTATDEARIRHNPFPSHTKQNELRAAWTFYRSSHDGQDQPIGLRGYLSQEYVRRIAAHRFGQHPNGGTVQLVQVRSATMPVGSPPWSSPKSDIDTATSYNEMPWWGVSNEDFT